MSAPGVYTVTDHVRTVEWDAGTPTLGATVERRVGRVREVGFRKVWAVGAVVVLALWLSGAFG